MSWSPTDVRYMLSAVERSGDCGDGGGGDAAAWPCTVAVDLRRAAPAAILEAASPCRVRRRRSSRLSADMAAALAVPTFGGGNFGAGNESWLDSPKASALGDASLICANSTAQVSATPPRSESSLVAEAVMMAPAVLQPLESHTMSTTAAAATPTRSLGPSLEEAAAPSPGGAGDRSECFFIGSPPATSADLAAAACWQPEAARELQEQLAQGALELREAAQDLRESREDRENEARAAVLQEQLRTLQEAQDAIRRSTELGAEGADQLLARVAAADAELLRRQRELEAEGESLRRKGRELEEERRQLRREREQQRQEPVPRRRRLPAWVVQVLVAAAAASAPQALDLLRRECEPCDAPPQPSVPASPAPAQLCPSLQSAAPAARMTSAGERRAWRALMLERRKASIALKCAERLERLVDAERPADGFAVAAHDGGSPQEAESSQQQALHTVMMSGRPRRWLLRFLGGALGVAFYQR